jgi:AAA domain
VARGHSAEADAPVYAVSLMGVDLRDPAWVDRLEALIRQTKAGFVIVDALADVTLHADENSVRDMMPAMQNLKILAEHTKTHILVIHHSNKAGGYRGSSALKGAVDLMLVVEAAEGGKVLRFRADKTRDGPIKPFAASVCSGLDSYRLETTETKETIKFSPSELYVLRFLGDKDDAPMSAIMDNADQCSANAARQATYKLAGKRYLERSNPGGRGVEARYRLILQTTYD